MVKYYITESLDELKVTGNELTTSNSTQSQPNLDITTQKPEDVVSGRGGQWMIISLFMD